MPLSRSRTVTTLAALALALAAGCGKDAAPAATDSSLAQDLALAQRNVAPLVFNDASVGGTAPAGPAAAAPSPRPSPPRANAPRPQPTPRRDNPPVPVMRTPRPSPQQPVAQAPGQAPAAAPTPAAGVIGAGSRVGMTTNAKVCLASTLVGDKFTATVSSPTMGTNGAMIPAGTTVVLEVAAVDRADPIDASHVQFSVRQIDVEGEPVAASGDVATLGSMQAVQVAGGNDRNKVIGGAVAGAVLGRIFGKSTKATVLGGAAGAAAGTIAANRSRGSDACLPEGSALRLTLSRDLIVRRGAI